MSRYIEIIFDNSGSMTSIEKGKPRHVLAKEIFNEVVIPQLGKRGDEMVLRTLRKGCNGLSSINKFYKKRQLKECIDDIHDFNNNTPLYLTIKDSIKACSNSDKTDKFIFILTDGDDNCGGSLESVLTKEELRLKDKYNTNVILVQFAITSNISQNNLTSLSQKLNAQNVIIGQKDLGNSKKIATKLNRAFINSGIDKTSKLDHCLDNVNDANKIIDDLELLELLGEFDFYLTELLHKEKLLSWKPNIKKKITPIQMLELEFVYTLRFKNNLPETLVKQMLSKLKSPYIYSHDCIYWDFKARKWKYHKKDNELKIIDNPDAFNDDNKEKLHDSFDDEPKQLFSINQPYKVVLNKNTNMPTFSINEISKRQQDRDARTLRDGDFICFDCN
jgi:hypothetical protein